MSMNHLLGNKKRNSSILYGVDQPKVTTASSSFQRATSQSHVESHGGAFPPNKRYKSHTATEHKEVDNPFEDTDDFTADDLEEIDIIATQALTESASLNPKSLRSEQNAELSCPPNNTIQTPDQTKKWNISLRKETASVGEFGSSKEETPSIEKFRLETLQAQYEEAMKKLKEMQEEILIKTGETKILRDSMQQMESAMEEQRKSYALRENENAQNLHEKEKEFSKKLQSLQSELQFRDAEMNELRTKLLNLERIKSTTLSVSNSSPKKSPPKFPKLEGSTQNEKNNFPTKDSFRSQIPSKRSSSKNQLHGDAHWINKDCKMPDIENEPVKQEKHYICAQRTGSILISVLMKQPVVPGSSLGLCHLLSRNIEEWPGPVTQSSSFNIERIGSSPEEEASLKIAQKLALTGLNLIAVDEEALEENSEENKKGLSHLKSHKISGAVYFLPLLEHHISSYHEALLLMMKAGNASSGSQSVYSSRSFSSTTSSVDDFLPAQEEFALTSLGILYYLVFYSSEVIFVLLSHKRKPDYGLECIEIPEKDNPVYNQECRINPQDLNPELDAVNVDSSQHPLFKKLLQLLASCATRTGCPRYNITKQCLRVLVKMAERSTRDLLLSFQHLLDTQTQTLLHCMSSESPLFAVHLTVRLLTLLAEHQQLAAKFCSSSETCLLLALYMYITSRPDKSASEVLWLELEQETVCFLTKCVQCCSLSVLLVGTDCQCNSEVVKALIIMLHRQWLAVRKVEGQMYDVHAKQVIQFLRRAVLLLHSLSQKDKLFHEHCLEVLHQYDYVMPGIRTILRKSETLKTCEGFNMFPASPYRRIETFVFMDLEATGLPPSQPKIAEMCLFAVTRHDLEDTPYKSLFPTPYFPRLVDKLCLCINPGKPFTPKASSITGLSKEQFASNKKQGFNIHVWHMITAFLSRQHPPICLVAHYGCGYDFPLLKAELSMLGISGLDEIYCADTFQALKALEGKNNHIQKFLYQDGQFGSKKKYGLRDLYYNFFKEYPLNSHSAEGDVVTLISVFQRCAADFMCWMDSNARPFNTIAAMYKENKYCASFPQIPPSSSSMQSGQGVVTIKNILLLFLGLIILSWISLKYPV